jgi:RNA polymerase sigma-70 factor (ECF subfamily)
MSQIASGSVRLRAHEDIWVDGLQLIAQGNQSALAAFYDATIRLVYGLSLRILGDPGLAEDVSLDVYMQVWRQAHHFDPTRGKPSTWLLTMTRSRAIDRLRANSQMQLRSEPLDAVEQHQSSLATPEEAAILSEERGRIRVTLETLTAEQREVVELAYFAGMSQTEIAQKLSQPLGTVKTRIRAGMMKLREGLQPIEAHRS